MGDTTLSVRLLGGFELRRSEGPAERLDSVRAESLIAYLLLYRGAAQPRQRVAFALWPDSAESQALTNLRHVLHTLRRAHPELAGHVEVTARTLRWRDDLPYHLDVAAFEDALARDSAQDAVEIYAGDLLVDRTGEWLEEERVRLRRRYLDALDRLVAEREEHGDLTGGVQYAERLLREDPLREETFRVLMRLYGARGDRARALRVYHECAATLERELGVEPAAATQAAYDALLARDERPPPVDVRLGGPPFVGRAAERAQGPHRRRLRRPRPTHPLVEPTHPTVPVPATVTTGPGQPQLNYLTGNRG